MRALTWTLGGSLKYEHEVQVSEREIWLWAINTQAFASGLCSS